MKSSIVPAQAIVLLTCWVGLALGVIIVMSSTFSVFFTPITDEFGWERSKLALAYSLFSLTSTFAMPFIGRLVDSIGARQVIVGCALIFAATTFLLRFATSLWHFYALFIVLGIISGGTSSLPYFKVLIRAFAVRRGFALGIANSGTALGNFMFPLLAFALTAAVGWRDAYLVIGVGVALLTTPVVLWGLRERGLAVAEQTPAHDHVEPATHNLTLSEALRTSQFWLIGIAFFIATSALVGLLIHLVPLLTDRGMPAQTAAFAASTFGIAQLVGRLGTGFLLDKFSSSFVCAGLWILAALSLLMLWAGIAGLPLFVCAALAGLAFGGEGDVLAYFTSRLFGAHSFGRIYSVLLMINLSGGVVGPYVFGAAFDAAGNYTAILGGMALATLIAAALILCVRDDVTGTDAASLSRSTASI